MTTVRALARWALVAVIAVFGWLISPVPATAASSAAAATIDSYDHPSAPAPWDRTDYDRGPPPGVPDAHWLFAEEFGCLAVSKSPSLESPIAHDSTYDEAAPLVRATSEATTSAQRISDDDTPVSRFVASSVAANSVPASTVRFSQSSVNGAAEIEASMRANGWVGDAIDVVRMPDGGLTSLDNTRLLAANRAGIDVQASIRGFDEALPSSLVGRFTTAKGGVPSTWGDAVMNRIGNQSAGYGTANPFGSGVTGWSGN